MVLTNEDLQTIGKLFDSKLDERLKPITDILGVVERLYTFLSSGRAMNSIFHSEMYLD